MSKILGSASKIVFILLTLSACVGFFMGRLEAKDFMLLAVGASSFYFSYKSESGSGLPYNGK